MGSLFDISRFARMGPYAEMFGQGLAITVMLSIGTVVVGAILGVILAAGQIKGTAAADKVYESIVAIKTAMDEKNVPKEGRKLVVSPAAEGALLLDSRFITGGKGENRLENGYVARAAGFDIYVSNATGMDGKMVAFHTDDVTFANQLTKTEAYRREKGFDDGVKGLNLCGAKVTRPEAVAVYTVA